MGVVIETYIWEPGPWLFLFLFSACFSSIFILPYLASHPPSCAAVFDPAPPASFVRFQSRYLLVFSSCSVIEGLGSIFGEFSYDYYGISKEKKLMSLIKEACTSLLIGSFLGIIFDLVGQKQASMVFCFSHLCVGALKILSDKSALLLVPVFSAITLSLYSFAFESWMVHEHEKLGYRQDLLVDTFWLMEFSKSASLVGSQIFANSLIHKNGNRGVLYPSSLANFVAFVCIMYIGRRWSCNSPIASISNYKKSLLAHIVKDKKIWLLALAQASLHFADRVFWILWAPIIVADGREVQLSMIFPCLLGARMLGSTAVPWFFNGPLSAPVEDILMAVFCMAGLVISVVAYDYQEILFLVALFCIFQAIVGLLSPLLAKLRSIFLPNDLRAGMAGLSLVPANAALLILIQASANNSTSFALSAAALVAAASCMYMLKLLTEQVHRDSHKLYFVSLFFHIDISLCIILNEFIYLNVL